MVNPGEPHPRGVTPEPGSPHAINQHRELFRDRLEALEVQKRVEAEERAGPGKMPHQVRDDFASPGRQRGTGMIEGAKWQRGAG